MERVEGRAGEREGGTHVLEAQQSVPEAAGRFLELFVCVRARTHARERVSERTSECACVFTTDYVFQSSVPLPFSLHLPPLSCFSHLWPSFVQVGQLSTEPFVLS